MLRWSAIERTPFGVARNAARAAHRSQFRQYRYRMNECRLPLKAYGSTKLTGISELLQNLDSTGRRQIVCGTPRTVPVAIVPCAINGAGSKAIIFNNTRAILLKPPVPCVQLGAQAAGFCESCKMCACVQLWVEREADWLTGNRSIRHSMQHVQPIDRSSDVLRPA